MQAGRMRHLVQLYAPPDPTEPDAYGDTASQPWTLIGSIWANIAPGKGREFWLAASTRADISHTVTLRYNPSVTTGCRLVWNDGHSTRTFELGPPLVTDERFFVMTFTAFEKKGPS